MQWWSVKYFSGISKEQRYSNLYLEKDHPANSRLVAHRHSPASDRYVVAFLYFFYDNNNSLFSMELTGINYTQLSPLRLPIFLPITNLVSSFFPQIQYRPLSPVLSSWNIIPLELLHQSQNSFKMVDNVILPSLIKSHSTKKKKPVPFRYW